MNRSERGSALLTVLWLVAGLTAIALALASTVRGEAERATTAVESARAYYLAAGAIDRAVLNMEWGGRPRPGGAGPYYVPGMPRFVYEFPPGVAEVEIVPETAKLNVNTASVEKLARVMAALGVDPGRAGAIAAAIVEWRSPGGSTLSDAFYLAQVPSFRARHSSFQETEELLFVRGMTPDIYYGTFDTDAQGRFHAVGGLRDCVSVFGAANRFDANYAHPAVMAAADVPAQSIQAVMARRAVAPFLNDGELQAVAGDPHLRVGGNSIFTLRATARPKTSAGTLSDLRRSVAAMVKFMPPGYDSTVHILRWYNEAYRSSWPK